MRRGKKQHEWGVVFQCHFPYREFHYCPLCRQYCEAGNRPLMSRRLFIAHAISLRDTNPMYHADSYDLFDISRYLAHKP